MLEEIRKGWQRFWALSWWWKGPILGVTAFIVLLVGIAVAGSGDNDTVVLEATQVPSPTPATATPTPKPSPATPTPSQEPTATTTPAPTQEPQPTPQPTAPPTPKPTPEPTPAPAPITSCDPSYPSVCIPVGAADYDCAGGSGNGPNYIAGPLTVLPPDPHGLDSDGDGVGCE